MAKEDPYKDMSRETMVAKIIELADQLNALNSKPKKQSFVLRNWHMVLVFVFTSLVSGSGLTLLAHAMYQENKVDPLYLIPCIFLGAISVVSFMVGLATFGDKKQLQPYAG